MRGSLRWVPSLHSCGGHLVTASSCLVGFFVLEVSPLKKSSAPLSAPQRPIATHRTTATPKAGPGVVRKNPGVGNGDDEAAELMQQVGPSARDGRRFGRKDAGQHQPGEACLCSWRKACLPAEAVLVICEHFGCCVGSVGV